MHEKDITKVNIPAVIALIITSFAVGVVYMWSAFKTAVEEYFSWSVASANLVSSVMLFAFTLGCFIGGIISDRIGPKKTSIFGIIMFGAGVFLSSLIPQTASIVLFYLTYGVIAGLGSGFVFTSTLSSLPKWFPNRVGLGTGLGATSLALSTLVFSPIVSALLGSFSVTVTLRILALITFVPAAVASFFIKLPDTEFAAAHPVMQPGHVQTTVNMNITEVLRTGTYWIFFLCLFFYNGAWNMITPLIKSLGIDRGLSETVAILCLSMTGVANALGRLVMSSLSDRVGRYNTMYILCVITAISSLMIAALGGSAYFAAVFAVAFAYGGPAAVYPALCTDLFGPKYSGRNYGFLMLGLGLSSVVFNLISNALYAATGGYAATFALGMATAVLTILLVRAIRVRANIS